jgi:hypothetical protein
MNIPRPGSPPCSWTFSSPFSAPPTRIRPPPAMLPQSCYTPAPPPRQIPRPGSSSTPPRRNRRPR